MKLWEIKLQALSSFFDSPIEYSEKDFSDGTIYENPNTKTLLNKMTQCIKGAIDLYYKSYEKLPKAMIQFLDFNYKDKMGNVIVPEPKDDLVLLTKEFQNKITISEPLDFHFPIRIDIAYDARYSVDNAENIDFNFDEATTTIYFHKNNYTFRAENTRFYIYYIMKKTNIDDNADDLTCDLNTLGIPKKVQNEIYSFVRGALFEENGENRFERSKELYKKFLILQIRSCFNML